MTQTMPITFKNKYGTVILTPVTAYIPVREISAEKIPAIASVLTHMNTVEQVTLITNNNYVQASFPYLTHSNKDISEKGYIIHHISASTACVCSVEVISFHSKGNNTAQDELHRIQKNQQANFA